MVKYPWMGAMLILVGMGTSGGSSGYTPEYLFSQTDAPRSDANGCFLGGLAEPLSKPLQRLRALMATSPIYINGGGIVCRSLVCYLPYRIL